MAVAHGGARSDELYIRHPNERYGNMYVDVMLIQEMTTNPTDETRYLCALQPADVEAGHCAHAFWVRGVTFLQQRAQAPADVAGVE